VIDEFADSWEVPKKPNGYTRYFAGHWEKDLRRDARARLHHPSVVILEHWQRNSGTGQTSGPWKSGGIWSPAFEAWTAGGR